MEYSFKRIKSKAITGVFKVMGEVADAVLSWVNSIGRDLTKIQDMDNLYTKMNECVNPKGGEVKARYNTISLGNLYLNLSKIGKAKFLTLLNDKFSSSKEDIDLKIDAYRNNTDNNLKEELEFWLLNALQSPRFRILKQFISLPEGLKFLVDMRADVIAFKKQGYSFFALDKDLRNILSSWFDVGLLDLRQITWDSPASLLEKLIMYEAVHAISSWEDLRHRLDSDRRCFAFFHYKMPDEPLIFVEVALVDHIVGNIQMLLDETAPAIDINNAKVAIFYSISNTQVGLSGINLGNFLIKRVVSKLLSELHNIKTYATLSPIPGFLQWLTKVTELEECFKKLNITLQSEKVMSYIHADYSEFSVEVQNLFLKLCAYYLIVIKNQNKAADPVAHFHLSNGASIKKLHWMADNSEKGLKSSMGIMVNYIYDLSKIDDNYENYVIKKRINCSKEILSLLKL
ncbi:malonyl-CoA decarboxylase [Candidatus Neoehrlichia procyonis]|uniref:Malonyl-CoA decarboxylase family protein n=1 Tax=Candidatus Neoehrlichia procyonis str. RAC413 TaxID=1359163 RepID=A0A0F3NLV8_9RICK|nr:malonyl-CoA decarboxylase [Candidatus Neoehrlichia lotoris]KJV68677.1 malonyl-CoA decarboxylase family protein [Candidatus Neoehrlichia lotoris str. RAC413]